MYKHSDLVIQEITRSLSHDLDDIDRGWTGRQDGALIGDCVGRAMEAYDMYQAALVRISTLERRYDEMCRCYANHA